MYLPEHRRIVEDIESPTAVYLGVMKVNGIPVDINLMMERKGEAEAALERIRGEIRSIIGDVNIGANCSTQAFKNYLYHDLRLPVLKTTESNREAADDETMTLLKEWCNKNRPDLVRLIELVQDYRRWGKIKTTYIDGYLKYINPATCCIHPDLLGLATDTGRMCCRNPNAQNMDAFYASVEIRDNPSLRGKPLIIGSLPHERGVVATCSYEARKYGVHSAMNIKDAFRLCPNGVYMHPNFDKYRAVSHQLHEIWNTYASAAETIALDEAYLDVTEQAVDLEGARRIAHTIKRRTREELGLSCSVGVAYSKTAAKIASEEKKPDGYFEIPTPEAFVNLIIDRDVQVLYTVGEMTAKKLKAYGIRTVRDIQNNQEAVQRLLGKQGRWITQIALGIDKRKVIPYHPGNAKSISREVTFQKDVEDYELLKDVLFLLSLCVEHKVSSLGLHGNGVTLKLTYADMRGITRSRATAPCDNALPMVQEAVRMLERVEKRPVRLVGIGLYNLSGEEGRQLILDDLVEDAIRQREGERKAMLEALQRRYGLDFAAHLEQIFRLDTLHKTVEYMRRKRAAQRPASSRL